MSPAKAKPRCPRCEDAHWVESYRDCARCPKCIEVLKRCPDCERNGWFDEEAA